MNDKIAVGDKAPDFSLPDHAGNTVTLASFSGKSLILYFYPKDDTSGCTQEALDFDAQADAFAKVGVAVLGVSPDSPDSHAKFKTKHGIGLPLASNEDKTMLEAYGVWTEKSMYGRKYMGVERSTVLIKPDGVIAAIWSKVKVPGHIDAVLQAVNAL
jgi:peroxiredoxin Q/BCP